MSRLLNSNAWELYAWELLSWYILLKNCSMWAYSPTKGVASHGPPNARTSGIGVVYGEVYVASRTYVYAYGEGAAT